MGLVAGDRRRIGKRDIDPVAPFVAPWETSGRRRRLGSPADHPDEL